MSIDEYANIFAVELLMPENLLRRYIRELAGIDIDDEKKIIKLAKKFGVSQQMMTLRIGQLYGFASFPSYRR